MNIIKATSLLIILAVFFIIVSMITPEWLASVMGGIYITLVGATLAWVIYDFYTAEAPDTARTGQ